MKQAGYILALVVLAGLGYLHFREPEVILPRRHLASPGTFYLVSYASLLTPKGIIGFEPGREVQFVTVNREKKLLRVTDGKYQIELPPGQLTNDLDVAALARNADAESQRKIAAFTEQERAEYEFAMNRSNSAYTQEIDRINRNAKWDSTVGNQASKLDEPAVQTNSYAYPYVSYSPYSYLYPSTANSSSSAPYSSTNTSPYYASPYNSRY